jgi:hypothetical protein
MRSPRLALCALLLASCNGSSPPALDAAPAPDSRAPEARAGDRALVDSPPLADLAACAQPTPFVPPGKPAGWKQATTPILVTTMGAANHRGQDVIALAGAPQLLVGKFAYGVVDKDLKSEEVEVFVQEQPPCGPWVSLGVALTSEDGQHGTKYGIEDDGGRVFFTVPAAHARPVGRYPVRMLVRGDHSMARFALVVVPPATSSVVFDIDGTLTTDDFQLVSQLFSKLLAGSYTPKTYAAADQVVKAWSARGYLVVYLTGRPDTLREVTLDWLRGQGFPPGAVHLTDTLAQALPTSAGVAKYKSDFLALAQQGAKLALEAAYGNAATDIEAYATAGVPKARTFIIGPEAGKQGTTAIADYPGHLPSLASLPPAPVPAPPALAGW